MNKAFYKNSTLFSFILSYFFILLLIETNEETQISFAFPTSFELINNDIVIVAKDGIHFYNQNLVEYEGKKIELSLLNRAGDIEKVSIAQFTEENGGYILILVTDILYIFDQGGTEYNVFNLTEEINGAHYGLTPYKKDGNKLIFIISYIDKDSSRIVIDKFEYNLETINTNKTKDISIQINKGNLKGVYCLIMKQLFADSNEILTCFYAIGNEIFTQSFDPREDYKELENLKYSKTFELFEYPPLYINAATNNIKIKALIYLVCDRKSFWMTFDFENQFSKDSQEIENDISYDIYKHKILYFQQTNEFITASFMDLCKFFVMVFNNEFNLEYKGTISIKDGCSYSDSFSIYYNGSNYTIIVGSGSSSTYKSFSEEFEIIEIYKNDDQTQITKSYDNENTENTENNVNSGDNKCSEDTEESKKYNLCKSCNTAQNYHPAEFKNNSFLHGFLECYNDISKPINFYFDSSDNKYKPCYETCRTCNQGGDGEINNCIECAINYIKKPGYPDISSTNCVAKCFYSYYYTPYGQYKCTNNSNCPEEADLYVVGENKCTDDCNKEGEHKYQYGGQCQTDCPKNTVHNSNNICIDILDNNSCAKSEVQIDLQEFLQNGGIELNAKNYAKEFSYTTKHVSLLYNDLYSILIYKDDNCIKELSINMPKIDFGSCYTKVQKNISDSTNDKTIIVLIERLNAQKKSSISYAFYHPTTGEKINAETICNEEVVVIKESVISQLNNTGKNMTSILILTDQNINVFNLSDEFFTDICYCFESPNGKDIPLKDRI